MKRIFLFCLFIAMSSSCLAEVIRLSEPVEQDEFSETFGQPLTAGLPVVNLVSLLTNPEKPERFQLTVRISKVCKKKGCFFMAQEGEHMVRISFRDYGFFVPTDSNGKIVTLAGELVTKELTGKQADHFNQDVGEKGAFKPGITYEIVADSVRIPKV